MPKEQLEFFLDIHCTVQDMAAAIGVSPRTIHRRLSEYRLSVRGSYTEVSDEDLDSVVAEINHHFPRHGYRNIEGHLEHRGIRVPRRRIRASLSRIDPEGVALRWSYTIQRRTYNVRGPNCLWHIDSLHALIRWGMVIHGGIPKICNFYLYYILSFIYLYTLFILFIYCIYYILLYIIYYYYIYYMYILYICYILYIIIYYYILYIIIIYITCIYYIYVIYYILLYIIYYIYYYLYILFIYFIYFIYFITNLVF